MIYEPSHRTNIIVLPQLATLAKSGVAMEKSAWHDPAQLAAFGSLQGSSPAMKSLYRHLEKVSPTDIAVLIIGESGTGKELVANAVHANSKRSRAPFVAINCGAIAPSLIEAELFGHERGSFTGATRSHKGCFERASGGTLFLDEITEMPIEMQARLLRALETGRVCRVGGEQEIAVDVRIIAATNRSPEVAIGEGRLRQDLWFRLAAFSVTVPPLRERGEDVVGLAQHFLTALNEREQTGKRFSSKALAYLRRHAWPGNVRELKNAVCRAYILAEDEIHFDDAGFNVATSSGLGPDQALKFEVGIRLEDAEKQIILATLTHHRGNKQKTAEILGVSLKTLYNRLNAYQLEIFNERGSRTAAVRSGY